MRRLGARALIPAALAFSVLFSMAPSSPAAAAQTTEAQQIIKIAKAQLGDPWRFGATGPRAFDCSGLVRYAYRMAGVGGYIHGRSARAIYRWSKAHHKTGRTNPKVGDLVIWGRGSHIGIYIGNGKAISTLRGGVRIHRVRALTAPFTTYVHMGMSTRIAS